MATLRWIHDPSMYAWLRLCCLAHLDGAEHTTTAHHLSASPAYRQLPWRLLIIHRSKPCIHSRITSGSEGAPRVNRACPQQLWQQPACSPHWPTGDGGGACLHEGADKQEAPNKHAAAAASVAAAAAVDRADEPHSCCFDGTAPHCWVGDKRSLLGLCSSPHPLGPPSSTPYVRRASGKGLEGGMLAYRRLEEGRWRVT
jgi:hypothetical protein